MWRGGDGGGAGLTSGGFDFNHAGTCRTRLRGIASPYHSEGDYVRKASTTVSKDLFATVDDCRRTEWLCPNGRGGFAMAAVNQMLTRRYHGLLVAAVDPPIERFVLLAKLDATVTIGGLTYELATNDYPEAVYPQGFKLLDSFTTEPYPTWLWRAGDALIEQTLCMVHREDSVFVRYRLISGLGPVQLVVRPLCTSRHFHSLASYQDIGPPTIEESEQRVTLHWPSGRPTWHLSSNGTFRCRSDWYWRFVLNAEADRGLDCQQDLFMPGLISATLHVGEETGLVIAATTANDRTWRTWKSAFDHAASRRAAEALEPASEDPLLAPLSRATRDFVVDRAESKTVLAGYPWFSDWGRDTFIALPGLCLVTGRYAEARSIIETFARHVSGGMIPNRFPDFGESPEYNTADASLWYIHAIDRYLAYSGDWEFIADQMYDVVAGMLAAHEAGTRHGIRLAGDGLLCAGEPGYALTWMDARVEGRSITPRIGKPVEINALWHNALRIAETWATRRKDRAAAERWQLLAKRAASAFQWRFWNESQHCLNDVVDCDGQEGTSDSSIRPNQLLAISLTHPILDRIRWKSVVDVCERELLTPVGLRTLAPGEPAYAGRYEGHMAQRDARYHQGTVWPWLLGPFVTAYVRAAGESPASRKHARRFLEGVEAHLWQAGIGSVSEVADGDPPHRPGGCPWQAWSVAEPLRVLCEDILQFEPIRHEPSRAREARASAAPV